MLHQFCYLLLCYHLFPNFSPLYSVEFVIQFQFTYFVMTMISLYLLVGVLAITSAYGELKSFYFLSGA